MIRMSVIFFSRHAFCNTFSTHDLSWRSTSSIVSITQTVFFQLTTSRGDRHVLSAIASSEHFFQLTTSRGDRQGIIGMNVKPLNFSTHDLSWRSTVSCEFNPNSFRFSTHDLSWRSTICEAFRRYGTDFSTHDLSWRSTAKLHNKSLKFCIFSRHFILEQMSLPFSYKYH